MVTGPASIPAVVIAAPASGSGKTTVTTGLIGALRAAGHRVAPFKVGPDYIDPGYHAVAAGRTGRNLDPNLVGADLIAPLFSWGTRGADIAVVEGVMGLFDGRITGIGADGSHDPDGGDRVGGDHLGGDPDSGDPNGIGSTAHVAVLIGAPIILVVDAAGHSQSLAAVLHGFLGFSPTARIAGVILNRVGSPRHEAVLRQACRRVGLPVFGVLHRDPSLTVPSRHLGLIPAAERSADAVAAVAAMTATVSAGLDVPAIVAAARTRTAQSAPAWSPDDTLAEVRGPTDPPAAKPVIAVAAGAAFTFGYAEHAEMLRAAGAETIDIDPLIDRLPEGTAGVVLGGGFPEEHAAELSSNTPLREDINALARSGAPIHAECAGLLYLCRELDGHPMAGVIDGVGRFGPRLTLGYRDAVAVADSVLYPAGSRVTGHEFHRSTVELVAAQPAWAWRDGTARPATDGIGAGSVHASYLHVHPVAVPRAILRFVRAAERRATQRVSPNTPAGIRPREPHIATRRREESSHAGP
ncbi:cobyrinate a,c-diamide synthase [Gordonia sp. N1V]|uniref:cobyrinate a,c-diamide synthase n=1 Tax=Gordonia sp. N1V TaxID=3034163 RepID=UPI0023E1C994|nr:cobyrinate a,c-diamide synthase [Gordonia sp. N1V]MDF3282086.1 cobyrinate a,c-diamide synthase [Gordonia sp. N1V]